MPAGKQSEVLVVSRKIRAFQSFYLQSKLSHKDICTSKGNVENSRMIMVGDVLQKIDCHVKEILATAGHVTLYDFDMELSQWSHQGVEGPLFVIKRRTQPQFQFIVMNRRSAKNLVEDLLSDFEYEINLPYLLYRNASQKVIGIWFYETREWDEVEKLFSMILNAFSKVPPKPKVFTNQSSEFQELESVPTLTTLDGPLEPSSSTSVITENEHFIDMVYCEVLNANPSWSFHIKLSL